MPLQPVSFANLADVDDHVCFIVMGFGKYLRAIQQNTYWAHFVLFLVHDLFLTLEQLQGLLFDSLHCSSVNGWTNADPRDTQL